MNLIVQPAARAGFLLTDTAAIRLRDGVVSWFASKVIPISGEAWSAAVAISGRLEIAPLTARLDGAHLKSLPEFLASLPDVFRNAERDIIAHGEPGPMAAVVAVFDQARSAPSGYGIANDNTVFPLAHRPYTLKPLAQHLTEMGPDEEALRGTNFRDPKEWDARRDALALIEAQRRDPSDYPPNCYSIGGQAVLTRVDASGISSEVIKTWPDRVGRRIDPHRTHGAGLLGLAKRLVKW